VAQPAPCDPAGRTSGVPSVRDVSGLRGGRRDRQGCGHAGRFRFPPLPPPGRRTARPLCSS